MQTHKKKAAGVPTYPLSQGGMTLVEVIISLTILTFCSSAIIAGFVYLHDLSILAAYRSGAIRVMQGHVERINNLEVSQLSNSYVVNLNYSGLRVAGVSSESAQQALTNKTLRTFLFNSAATTNVNLPLTQTNMVEDATMGYLTTIRVADKWLTNSYLGTVESNLYKQVDITVYWHHRGRNHTNTTSILRPLIN